MNDLFPCKLREHSHGQNRTCIVHVSLTKALGLRISETPQGVVTSANTRQGCSEVMGEHDHSLHSNENRTRSICRWNNSQLHVN